TLHQANHVSWELAGATSPQDERTERSLCPEQWDHKRCAKPRFNHGVAQWFARALGKVGYLQWLSLGHRLGKPRFSQGNVKLSEPCDHLFVKPCRLTKLEFTDILTIVENRASISAGEVNGTIDNRLQHRLQIKRRAHRAADLAQRLKLLHRPG